MTHFFVVRLFSDGSRCDAHGVTSPHSCWGDYAEAAAIAERVGGFVSSVKRPRDQAIDTVEAWLGRGGDAYEIHMRAEMAKLKGWEFAFSDEYRPRTHYSRQTAR